MDRQPWPFDGRKTLPRALAIDVVRGHIAAGEAGTMLLFSVDRGAGMDRRLIVTERLGCPDNRAHACDVAMDQP